MSESTSPYFAPPLSLLTVMAACWRYPGGRAASGGAVYAAFGDAAAFRGGGDTSALAVTRCPLTLLRTSASSARRSSLRGAGATEREAEPSASPSTAEQNKAGYTMEQG
jgi:hypothetical protein